MSDRCVFCRIIRGETSSYKVYEDGRALAFLDINPSAPGHTLIIPKAHVARVEDLQEEDAISLFSALHRLVEPIQRAVEAPACTIGINNGPESGQEIPHVHVHVIPRSRGDHGGIIQGVTRTGRPQRHEIAETAAKIRELASPDVRPL
ncbi:MAG: HIT family protein [Candidatus Bathyarchaeota archaeon]|nr:MAG: HIT family protein [Candidatus Bathyarchaeota archaeon]